MNNWLSIDRGEAPLIVSVPHAGLEIPKGLEEAYVSLERARYDADYHVDRLYAFAGRLDATVVRTAISRAVIDVNRDPSGRSLYPGQPTTELCPTTDFAGAPLYRDGQTPGIAEVARRRETFFDPYHAALTAEIERLRGKHPAIVLYDAHSIRSCVPRLFAGELPLFNIGSFDGAACSQNLIANVAAACEGAPYVVDGRFKGGWITRHYGAPAHGVHAIQMELAMRGYLDEDGPWPPAWNGSRASALQEALRSILTACLAFAASSS